MVDFFKSIETFFATYSFSKDVILVVFGAVFGGICTVIINNGAIRKQCKFDMQYKILSDEAENITSIYKKIETIEIGLSFGDRKIDKLKDEIDEVQYLLLALNERLRNKRKFVKKYMSALVVEKSAQFVTDYMKLLYTHGKNGIFDFVMISEVDDEKLSNLRNFKNDFQKYCNDMVEAMEMIIEPSIFSRVKRKLRKPAMFIEECNAIRKVHNHNKKGR